MRHRVRILGVMLIAMMWLAIGCQPTPAGNMLDQMIVATMAANSTATPESGDTSLATVSDSTAIPVTTGPTPMNKEPPISTPAPSSATDTPVSVPSFLTKAVDTSDLHLAIDDDFNIEIWDDSQWDPFLRSEYAVRQEGVLMFRTPVGSSEFTAYTVDSALPGLPMAIRQVSFAIKVTSQPESKRGDLGVEVSCGVEAGRFVIFWGGPQEEMWINSVSPDGEDNLEYLRVRPGEENLIDLLWLDGEIAVSLNGGERTVVLPAFLDLCWINFSALLQQGETVSGYIDNVKVWTVDTTAVSPN